MAVGTPLPRLGEARVLSRPLLYLGLHLKSHRDTYYERLQAIRTDGDWEAGSASSSRG